ncbi:MAG: cell division protein ZapA [Oscillospiraceae bacterium]|nr:cell division protein ZapA [Oscillospiraceae bacterium]
MSSRLTIEIYGTRYSITTTEDAQYVQDIAREADKALTSLMRNSSISLNQALVLMMLHYLDAHKKSEESADHLRGQVTEYLKDAQDARAELSAAQQRIDKSGKKR